MSQYIVFSICGLVPTVNALWNKIHECFVRHFVTKHIKKSPLSLWSSKFWENDQNCLLGSYSRQWHYFKPNPSTQFSSTVFRNFLKMAKMQLMRFAAHLLIFEKPFIAIMSMALRKKGQCALEVSILKL